MMPSSFRVRAGALTIEDDHLLLIRYEDQLGIHYNLSGGGVHSDESVRHTVKRELINEACIDVTVNDLVFAYEYLPHFNNHCYGSYRN